MAHHPAASSPSTDPPASLVRAELERILASDLFTRSERLSAFLKFIVDRTLAGEGHALKEHVIAIEVYGKSVDFNTAADPIVRVDARRLRDRLREYYDTDDDREIVISVPKGSYTPAFHRRDGHVDTPAPVQPAPRAEAIVPASTRTPAWKRWWIVAAALALMGAGWGVGRVLIDDRSEPVRLLTATSMPGAEENPSLSPDGNVVTFSAAGSSTDASHDIWIKAVEGDVLRNLTNTRDEMEKNPKFSPDGQYVAFTRYVKGRPSVFKVSALGGAEEMIAADSDEPDWLPDGRSLVLIARTAEERAGLVHHVLETGTRRVLTVAPMASRDSHPQVSPDGTKVAFTRYGDGRSALLVMPLSGGEPVALGDWNSLSGGLTWTPDGREILVARPGTSGRRLVRLKVASRAPEVPVAGIPHGSQSPSVSHFRAGPTYRLAVVSSQHDIGLRLVDLRAPRQGDTITSNSPFCDATRMDTPGRFSPDGRQVAFASDRSGNQQLWVANVDGSALRSVTELQDATVSLGSWSPDGRWLAFDATIGGKTQIYVVPVGGGPLKRVTDGTATEIDPEWSRDGRWIYYASDESGQSAIWKVSASGGARTQLSPELGFEPRESPDGRSIYFIDRRRSFGLGPVATLKRVAVDGGPAERVDVPVMAGAWEVTDAGIVFVFVPGLGGSTDFARAPDVLQLYDFADRRIRTLGTLAFRVGPFGSTRFLTVSRDGNWAVASHVDRWERDILVVDRFR
jgi:Tol biopolymer transport system component